MCLCDKGYIVAELRVAVIQPSNQGALGMPLDGKIYKLNSNIKGPSRHAVAD